MSSETAAAFKFLHRVNVASFGTTFKLWWPATRKSTSYTIPATGVASPLTAKDVEALGAIIQTQDAIVIHATKEDCPYPPQADDLFRWGPSAAGKKYKVLTCAGMEDIHPHYRITAVFASS